MGGRGSHDEKGAWARWSACIARVEDEDGMKISKDQADFPASTRSGRTELVVNRFVRPHLICPALTASSVHPPSAPIILLFRPPTRLSQLGLRRPTQEGGLRPPTCLKRGRKLKRDGKESLEAKKSKQIACISGDTRSALELSRVSEKQGYKEMTG